MYLLMFLKVCGQDRAVYFTTMPFDNWPTTVDAGGAVPSISPARRLMRRGRMALEVETKMGRPPMSVRNFEGSGQLRMSHTQKGRRHRVRATMRREV